MPQFTALDNVAHADLKVATQFGAAFENNVNQTLVFPTEFQLLQREYPIFFRKNEDGAFYAVALLGLDKDENLYLDNDQWQANYIPAVQKRGPFALAINSDTPDADPVVQVDVDDARVSAAEGEALFLPFGGNTPYFDDMLMTLRRIHVGSQVTNDFFKYLEQFQLIEPVTVQASFSEHMQYTVPDIYSISKERMKSLTGDELFQLNQLGLLEHCFAVMASADNMSCLTDKKAIRLAETGVAL